MNNTLPQPPLVAPAPHAMDDLAEAFASQLVRWASRAKPLPASAAERIRQLGRRLMRDIGEGHVCLAETVDNALAGLLLERGLADHGMPPDDPLETPPLVLDGAGRLYLRRHFDFEQRLATDLAQRCRPTPLPDADAVARRLDAWFPAQDGPDWQRAAVAQALARPLSVISGGPGTGKTTTVARLLACLLSEQAGLRIALAAPTGKAAARMEESLRRRAGEFPPELQALLPTRASTLHRLLGVRGDGGFTHHRGHPLPVDLLVVDEASMLDLALATRLLDALPASARLILLGDKDQLAAVEAGAVFAELCADAGFSAPFGAWLERCARVPAASLPATASPLTDGVISLSHSHRFAADSDIGRLAGHINRGEGDAATAWLVPRTPPPSPLADGDGVSWLDDLQGHPGAPLLQQLQAGYRPYLEALRHSDNPASLFAAFERFRVLCAQRDGPRGVHALNRHLEQWLRQQHPHPANPGPLHPWYVGRPVMITRNDYATGLFNGDIGLCLPGPDGVLQVLFPDGPEHFRALPTLRLPSHDTAFALTVHKSQGSEFDAIALLLPERDGPLLTRELIYTGLTRARRRALLAGDAERLRYACAHPTRRASGLRERLGAALTGTPAS